MHYLNVYCFRMNMFLGKYKHCYVSMLTFSELLFCILSKCSVVLVILFLKGLSFQIAAVLVSIAIYAYVEHGM